MKPSPASDPNTFAATAACGKPSLRRGFFVVRLPFGGVGLRLGLQGWEVNLNAQATGQAPNRRLNRRVLGWSFAVLLLCIPGVAMQFTREVNWGPEDFLAAALLIGTAGLGCELAARLKRSRAMRLFVAGAVLLGVLLVWAELAVGIVD